MEIHESHGRHAFRDWTWWSALVLLVANDHWWKRAGLLPGAVTGKLSDFAGLLVAPAVAAWLLRVRTHVGWLACHALVGGIFVAINVSPEASRLYEQITFGRNVPDPTDLVALPMLALSFARYAPRRPGDRAAHERWIAIVASLACVATPKAKPPPCPPETIGEQCLRAFRARLFVHNAAETPVSIRVRVLRAGAEIACEAVRRDPCTISQHLGDPKTVQLRPRSGAAIEPNVCALAWIELDPLLPPVLLIDERPTSSEQSLVPEAYAPDSLPPTGGVVVDRDALTIRGSVRAFSCAETDR